MKSLALALVLLGASSCVTLDPAVIAELAKDQASICISTDIRGGVGGVMAGATGGYGQHTLHLCRSNKESATLSIAPDGTMSITNGN